MRFLYPGPGRRAGELLFWSVQGAGLGAPAEGGHTGAARVGGFAAGPAAPAPCAILFLCTRGSVSLSRCQVAQFDRLMQGKGPLYWNLHKI